MSSRIPRPFVWPVMTAPMDSRSQPDKVPWGQWRYVLNARAIETGRLCRREGWRRFGCETDHPNCDLHDQHGGSEKIRTLYSHKSPTRTNSGNRLYAATQTDIWQNRNDGGWRIVAQNMLVGSDWEFTSLNDIVIAVNGRQVLWQRPALEGFANIPSLATIGLTGAAVCWVYEGVLFLADVAMDNTQIGHRVVWADINSIEFEPTTDSIAGFRDLMAGERILAAVPTGTTYTIFTTHGAWRQGVQDGQFVFQQLYFNKTRDACAISKRAIVSNREIAYFIASDGIYALSPYSPSPEWSEWMNKGLSPGFLTNDNRCLITASAYDTVRNEILFSAESLGMTYLIAPRQGSTSMMDHAFTALLQADVDRGPDAGMWWVSSGICTEAHINERYPIGDRDDQRVFPAVGSASNCDPFAPVCDECASSVEMLAVSAQDNTIKKITDDHYAREMRVGGGWQDVGYATRLVTGSVTFGSEASKRVNKVTLDFTAGATDSPGHIRLIVGMGGSAMDPLVSAWPEGRKLLQLSQKRMKPPSTRLGDAPNVQPTHWDFMADGRFLFFELRIDSSTGGASCFSNFTVHVAPSPNTCS